jgi:hypothetical protein
MGRTQIGAFQVRPIEGSAPQMRSNQGGAFQVRPTKIGALQVERGELDPTCHVGQLANAQAGRVCVQISIGASQSLGGHEEGVSANEADILECAVIGVSCSCAA